MDIKVPIFPHVCGHSEFLWDLSVHLSIGLFVCAHHIYSFSWGEGGNLDSLAGVHSVPPVCLPGV